MALGKWIDQILTSGWIDLTRIRAGLDLAPAQTAAFAINVNVGERKGLLAKNGCLLEEPSLVINVTQDCIIGKFLSGIELYTLRKWVKSFLKFAVGKNRLEITNKSSMHS